MSGHPHSYYVRTTSAFRKRRYLLVKGILPQADLGIFAGLFAVITPKRGLLVGFRSNHKFVHAVRKVLSGKRSSLPVWFSVDSTKAMQV